MAASGTRPQTPPPPKCAARDDDLVLCPYGRRKGLPIVVPNGGCSCHVCEQEYGANEKDLEPESEHQLKWRVFNAKVVDGVPSQVAVDGECYVCWAWRRSQADTLSKPDVVKKLKDQQEKEKFAKERRERVRKGFSRQETKQGKQVVAKSKEYDQNYDEGSLRASGDIK